MRSFSHSSPPWLTYLCFVTAFASLFDEHSKVPSLTFVDLSSNRDVDNNNPTGPEDEPVGLASSGFIALMSHSGQTLTHLDISSCG